MAKIFYLLLPFYLLSFVASTAGEEIFGWAIFLLFLFDISFDLKKIGFKNVLKNLKIGADIPILFFGLWVLIATYILFHGWDEVSITFRSVRWIPLLYGFSYLLKKYFNPNYKKHFNFIMIAAAVVGLYGVLQMFTRIDFFRATNEHISQIGNFYRATGLFKVPLTYAYCMGMVGFYALAALLIQIKEKKNYILPAITTITTIAAIIASSTRGAWIAFFVGAITITFILDRKKGVLVFIASALIIGTMSLEPSIQKRIVSIFNTTTEGSNTERINLWKANFAMFKDNPVLGTGYERNKYHLDEYYQKLNIQNGFHGHAHNDFLNTLSGSGLPGTIAWIWFVFYYVYLAFKDFRKSKRYELQILTLGALGAQIYYLVGGLTQCNFTDNEVKHIIIFTWAIVIAIHSVYFSKDQQNLAQ